MIPLNGKGKFLQGFYTPKNPQKYVGKGTPIYRSSWELQFFRWVDHNANVLEWASEAVVIPYQSPLDGKVHRYFTDGVIAIREGANIVKYLIEIKPLKQLSAPKSSKRKKNKSLIYETQQYATNQAKWSAARNWCASNGYKFQILTEKELFPQTSN